MVRPTGFQNQFFPTHMFLHNPCVCCLLHTSCFWELPKGAEVCLGFFFPHTVWRPQDLHNFVDNSHVQLLCVWFIKIWLYGLSQFAFAADCLFLHCRKMLYVGLRLCINPLIYLLFNLLLMNLDDSCEEMQWAIMKLVFCVVLAVGSFYSMNN